MTDLDDKTPNARLLRGDDVLPREVLDLTSDLQHLDISSSPFTSMVTIKVHYDPNDPFPFGFRPSICNRLRRAYITDFTRPPVAYTLRAARRTLLGSYVVSISDLPIFTLDDIDSTHRLLCAPHQPRPATIVVVLAPERRSSFDDRSSPSQLRLHDIRYITALRSTTGEGTTVDIRQDISSTCDLISADQLEFIVNRLQSSMMTDEEKSLPKLTRRRLLTLPNWPVWDAACDKQLEAHYTAGAFLLPIPQPEKVPGTHLNILRMHWTYAIKDDGTRKA